MSPTLDGTLGAAFIGMVATSILYGITCIQTFLYFNDVITQKDSRVLKSTVAFLWILDTIHTALTAHALYFDLVTNFGNMGILLYPAWSMLAGIYVMTLSNFIVRAFFAKRVYILYGEKRFLARFILFVTMVLAVIAFSLGCGLASRGYILKTFKNLREASDMLYISFAAGVSADTIIAASLCTVLVRSRTGFKRTDSIISFLMAFTINTGLLTSICALATPITYAIWPDKFIFMGSCFALGKLYINSLLASLNTRSALRHYYHGSVATFPMRVLSPIEFPVSELQVSRSGPEPKRQNDKLENGVVVSK